jgi:hypothetical protein
MFEVNLAEEHHVWRDRPKSLRFAPEVVGHRVLDFFHHGPLPENIDYSKKIAFMHPSRRGVFCFVNQDMPHVVKRCVNCLENHTLMKHDADNELRPLALKMIHRAWQCFGGGMGPNFIRTDEIANLTSAHFEKNCFSRMRVGLAVQVVSTRAGSMMVKAAAGECGPGCAPLPERERVLYSCLIELCKKLDRIVDIMNARGERGAPIMNSPQHGLIGEVLDILKWFSDWRSALEAAEQNLETAFFGKTLWEDLPGLLLGVACTARFNLAMFPGESMLQRRLDQDVCEHHFNHVRQGGGSSHSNPAAYEACRLTAVAGTVHAASLGNRGNSSGAHVTVAEAMEPLARKRSRR